MKCRPNLRPDDPLSNAGTAENADNATFHQSPSPDFLYLCQFGTIPAGMKMQLKTAVAVLAGIGMGIAAVHGLHGDQVKAPPAFVISNIEVTDPAKYQKYAEAAAGVVAAYHGKILTRGGKAVVFDGRAPQRVVVIEFPTMADAERWRASSEFQKAQAATTTIVNVYRELRD